MAYFNVDFFSASLMRNVGVQVIIPNDQPGFMTANNPNYQRPVKTLYLFHGYTANGGEWALNSHVNLLAGKYNLAVVMPNIENSFYLNRPVTGQAYGTFVGKELPEYIRKTFGLSKDRADTFVGGNSMGGFGALHTALAYPDTFSKAALLSPALILHEVAKMQPGMQNAFGNYEYFHEVFGNPDALLTSDKNPEQQLRDLIATGKELPAIFLTVGVEDFLYGMIQAFRDFMDKNKVAYTYEESDGAHDFDFWNRHLEAAVRFLIK